MGFELRNCPVCDSNEAEESVRSVDPTENMDIDQVAGLWGVFDNKSFFTYDRCVHCRTLYCRAYPSDEQLDLFYSQLHANMNAVRETVLQQTQLGYFNKIERYCKSSGGYLELGPDVGYFAGLCARAGAFDKYWLVEPNRQVWNELSASVGNSQAIHLLSSTDALSQIEDGSVTFASAIHVLDHLTKPVDILRQIRSKMKAGGIFIAVTHDERSTMAKVLGHRWPAYCRQHPQIYNPRSIGSLFSAGGFEMIDVVKTVNYFPLGFLLRQGSRAIFNHDPVFLQALDQLILSLRLGNILSIARLN